MPLLSKRSELNVGSKLLLYTACLRPILTYGALALCTMAKSHITTMEVLQNRMLRLIVGAPWMVRNQQLRADLNIPSVKDYLLEMAARSWLRADESLNPLIARVIEPQDKPPPKILVRRIQDVIDLLGRSIGLLS